jgi:hypothetical protein
MTTETAPQQTFNENAETDLMERSQNWETNHERVKRAIGKLIRSHLHWPTKEAIATETGLSRSTVYRHMEQFSKEDMMANELEELKFMTSQITATMVDLALDGDIRAMRLAYELTGALKKGKQLAAPVEKKV